jgi:hypothetical protein
MGISSFDSSVRLFYRISGDFDSDFLDTTVVALSTEATRHCFKGKNRKDSASYSYYHMFGNVFPLGILFPAIFALYSVYYLNCKHHRCIVFFQ